VQQAKTPRGVSAEPASSSSNVPTMLVVMNAAGPSIERST
jgi:hypothetical protein